MEVEGVDVKKLYLRLQTTKRTGGLVGGLQDSISEAATPRSKEKGV